VTCDRGAAEQVAPEAVTTAVAPEAVTTAAMELVRYARVPALRSLFAEIVTEPVLGTGRSL
jgi:hypothetical protein